MWCRCKKSSFYAVSNCCYTTNRARSSTHNKIVSAKEIRDHFLSFFSKRGHTIVPSSSTILPHDPSLLFVNSGMNQFKPVFLERTLTSKDNIASLKRVVNCQRCIRVGGKHNDLDAVGNDLYHHTFFEMLGNWSFGDYFKHESCFMALQLLTEVYKLPKDRLYVTYFGGDETFKLPADNECREVWLSLGLSEDHIVPFGMVDNFWEMGAVGPCGPSTEIHYDYLGSCSSETRKKVNSGSRDIVELWNIVFMQYNRMNENTLVPLPRCHIDTGMGLERLTSILQGKRSNYDTDIFVPILNAIHEKSKAKPYSGLVDNDIDVAYRIIADHARMITIAISDGVRPDKRGIGHLLRRVMRKAFLCGQVVLGTSAGSMCYFSEVVTSILGDIYPILWDNLLHVKEVIKAEEDAFLALLDNVSSSLARLANKSADGVLKGTDAFELHVRSGISGEHLEIVAQKYNLKFDWEGFKQCVIHRSEKNVHVITCRPDTNVSVLLQQSNISPTENSLKYDWIYENGSYRMPNVQAQIVALLKENCIVDEVNPGQHCVVVLDKTHFYAESGGQVGDRGFITSSKGQLHVNETKYSGNFILHCGYVISGILQVANTVTLQVDRTHRVDCMRNHTASHLLNSAVRCILSNTSQTSSRVSPEKLRMEFASSKSFTIPELQKIEDFVKASIRKSIPVQATLLSLEVALQQQGLIFLKNELYPDPVRMITIKNVSRELCCGTHVENTLDLMCFVLMSQKNTGLNRRTLTAVTGSVAIRIVESFGHLEEKVKTISESLFSETSKSVLNLKKLSDLLQGIKNIRFLCKSTRVPLVGRLLLEDKIHTLDRKCSAAIRKYNSRELRSKITEKWWCAVSMQGGKNFISLVIEAIEDPKEIFKHLNSLVGEKPTIVFVCNSDQIAVCCWVPQRCISKDFSAEMWAAYAVSNFGGKTISQTKRNPQLLCSALLVKYSSEDLNEMLQLAERLVDENIRQ